MRSVIVCAVFFALGAGCLGDGPHCSPFVQMERHPIGQRSEFAVESAWGSDFVLSALSFLLTDAGSRRLEGSFDDVVDGNGPAGVAFRDTDPEGRLGPGDTLAVEDGRWTEAQIEEDGSVVGGTTPCE